MAALLLRDRQEGRGVIKSELIARIADGNHHLYHKDIERIVNVILDEIVDALSRGDRVELRGFGAFTVKHRAPRTGRNPRTGASVKVDEKFVPFFKSGRELRERLNRSAKPAKSAAKSAAKAGAKSGGQTGGQTGGASGGVDGGQNGGKTSGKAGGSVKPGRPRTKRAGADAN